ncbi:MAG TPA: hypothetical protein VIR31_00220 [Nitrososphaeraceae archaeon]
MEGRLTGLYKSNDSKQSSPKYSTFFDTFYGSTRRLDASSSFFSSSFYSNPFIIMPYTRSGVYRYPSAESNSYSDLLYKGMKSSSSSTIPSQDLVSQMTTEYGLELARGLAHRTLSATSTTTPQPNMQPSQIQGGLGNNSILDVQNKQEDVFGYRFKICKDCLLTHPLQVKYGKDGTKDNSNNDDDDDDDADVVARIEQKHVCDPKLVAYNRKEVLDKEGSVKAMVDELPENTIRMTKSWIKNQKKNYSLIAIKIPHKSKNESNIADNSDNIEPEQQNIKISNPKNPKQQITFQYPKEKHVNLSLTSNENTKNHWAARAIKDGSTILVNDEMEDFLKMIQTSTFAIFKIRMSSPTTTKSSSLPLQHQHQHQQQQDESIGLYFLTLLPYDDTLYPASLLPNKSNNNNNKNNKSVQSNSTDGTFSSLYNHLVNISNFTIPIVNSQSSLSLSSS